MYVIRGGGGGGCPTNNLSHTCTMYITPVDYHKIIHNVNNGLNFEPNTMIVIVSHRAFTVHAKAYSRSYIQQ